MCKRRLAILFGGRSAEHEVSLLSAACVAAAVDLQRFAPLYIGITKDGSWKRYQGPPELAAREIGTGTWQERASAFAAADLAKEADFALPLLHGPYGEDGCIQGFLETLGLPYGGCGVLASAVSMDKQIFKQLMKEKGLPVCDFLSFTREELARDLYGAARRIKNRLGLPCFIKPANMGSSVGISKAGTEAELLQAFALACRYDDKIVAEEYIDARELEIAFLGGKLGGGNLCLSTIGEILPACEFYDYRAKYGSGREAGREDGREAPAGAAQSGASKLLIPAPLKESTALRIRELAAAAFEAVDGYGFGRADFFVENGTDNIYINEINTIPGFTKGSMFPLLWQAAGLSVREIIERIVDLGYERDHLRNNRHTAV